MTSAPPSFPVSFLPLPQVQFLHEDLLLSKLAAGIEALLSGANTSRTFYGKSLAHGG